MKTRCKWCTDDPLYIAYHDSQWGVPIHNDQILFEFILLEGAQAGLNWLTILKKRENYRKAFSDFDPEIVAKYTEEDVTRLLSDAGIVRNSLKIVSAIKNARGVLNIQAEFGSLNTYLWAFVEGVSKQNEWQSLSEIPAKTEISEKMSKDLKKRGFNFVGPTICYALMQAIGMVNDHTIDCFRYEEIKQFSNNDRQN